MDVKEESRRSDALYNDASGAITRRYLTDRLAACESIVKSMRWAISVATTIDELHVLTSQCEERARLLGL